MLGVSISFISNYLIMLKIEKYISLLTYLQITNKKSFHFVISLDPKKVLCKVAPCLKVSFSCHVIKYRSQISKYCLLILVNIQIWIDFLSAGMKNTLKQDNS